MLKGNKGLTQWVTSHLCKTRTLTQDIRKCGAHSHFCRRPDTTYLCRRSLSSSCPGTLHLFRSCLSGKPRSSCIFWPIHSARVVGRYWTAGWCLLCACVLEAHTKMHSSGWAFYPASADATAETLNGLIQAYCIRSNWKRDRHDMG